MTNEQRIYSHKFVSQVKTNKIHKNIMTINGTDIVCDELQEVIIFCEKCGLVSSPIN